MKRRAREKEIQTEKITEKITRKMLEGFLSQVGNNRCKKCGSKEKLREINY
jgi:hypothetical protein